MTPALLDAPRLAPTAVLLDLPSRPARAPRAARAAARGRVACLLAALLALAGGCRNGNSSPPKPAEQPSAVEREPVVVTVARVDEHPVERMVPAVGTLRGFEEIMLTPKVEGRVLRLYHDVGDRVKPGERLIEIDPTDYQLAVVEAEEALKLEWSKLGLTAAPGPEFDVEQLPSVVRARHVYENAVRRKDRIEPLHRRNLATEEQWEQIVTDVQVAEANLRQAVLEVKSVLAAAEHRQAILDSARQRLADTRLIAPPFPSLEGALAADYVVAERLASEGEMVRAFPSTAVMRLVIDQPLKLVGPVAERYMGEVAVGQTVKLRVDAYGDEIFSGRLTRVGPTVDRATRTFQYEALIDNAQGRLKVGGFARVGIFTRVDPHALTIPREALVSFAGVHKVFVVADGTARAVEVRPGVEGRGWIEIAGPLAAGVEVATSGQSKLSDGSAVRVRTRPAAELAERPAP